MSTTNGGPSVTTTPNYVSQSAPAGSASVPFDPSSVAITGGTIPETFRTKLQRLARAAEISNTLINPPWTIPAAWTALTVYSNVGEVYSNAGSWYMLLVAGTSAGSGGPSTTTSGSSIADGSCFWMYIGGPTLTASDGGAATFTTSTAGTPSGLANIIRPTSFPTAYRVTGGYTSTFSSFYWAMKTFEQKLGSTATYGGEVRFKTDAPKFAVGYTNGSPAVRVSIDGRYHTIGSTTPVTGGTPNWQIFDFSATSARKERSIVVEGGKTAINFAGVSVGANDQVWSPGSQDTVRAAFISDSLMAGSNYGPFLCGGMVPQRVGKLLGWDDCWNFSTGGTGYINAGASMYTYGQRIAEALTRNPDIWVFMGSTNDIGQPGIQAAALAAFQAVRAGGSTAPIIVLGLWPINNAGVSATELAVQAAVTQFNDSRTFFVPIYADPVLPWVTGAWNNSANTNSTNAGMYITTDDNTHPSDIGTAYLANRIAQAIKTNVLPSSALSYLK